jgi:aminopeptidase
VAAELERIDRYAELIVQIGANVQPGQTVEVTARIEHAHVARAVARASYRAGAAYVDVLYSDQHVRRAMIEHAADDVLSWTPPWLLQRAKQFGKENAAIVALVGDAEPELLADLPGDRVGKARMKELGEEVAQQTNEGLNNWVVTRVPSEGWASQLFGTPDVDALWSSSSSACGSTRTTLSRPGGRTCRSWVPAPSCSTTCGSTRCAIAGRAPT